MWGRDAIEDLVQAATRSHCGENLPDDNIWRRIGFDGDQPRLGWAVNYTSDQIRIWAEPIIPIINQAKGYLFVGMGGSINTVKLVRDFFGVENIYTIDNPDEDLINKTVDSINKSGINLDELLVIAISKSGTTFETHTVVNALKNLYTKSGLDIYNHLVWLIDKVNQNKLKERGWNTDRVKIFSIQVDEKTDIGGRFTCPKTGVFFLPLLIYFRGDLETMLSQVSQTLDRDPVEMCCVMVEERVDQIVSKVSAYPKVELIVPSIFRRSLESFRIWVNQLYQESLGGKVEGFDPKILPVTLLEAVDDKELDSLVSKKRLVRIDISGLGIVNWEVTTELDVLMEVVLLLEYMVAMIAYRYSVLRGDPLNFVNQPNVQFYKKRMQEIDKVESQPIEDLQNVEEHLDRVLKEKEGIDFLEIIYYGPDDVLYSRLREKAKEIARSRELIELVFRGPDWNHHAFQSAPTCKHTVFMILTDARASENVKLISQATYEVLRDHRVPCLYSWVSESFLE